MKCPECKKEMKWQEGLLTDSGSRDKEVGRYYCMKCRIFARPKESKEVRKGRALAHELGVVNWNDKRLLAQSASAQIGYFREIQHCATCGNAIGEPCLCKNCDCLYCREYK